MYKEWKYFWKRKSLCIEEGIFKSQNTYKVHGLNSVLKVLMRTYKETHYWKHNVQKSCHISLKKHTPAKWLPGAGEGETEWLLMGIVSLGDDENVLELYCGNIVQLCEYTKTH